MATNRQRSEFEDGVTDYLREVSKNEVLTREGERELFQRMEQGDESAREELVRCNLRFVVKIALRYKGHGLPLADLVQEGNVGLLTVISKFDWRKGCRFSTYAAFWIRQEIQAALRRRGSLIRLPVRKARLLAKINDAVRQFTQNEGREPDEVEIAAFLGLDVEKIEAVLPFRERILSLEAERGEDGATLLDMVPEEGKTLPGDRLMDNERRVMVNEALRVLNAREREVMVHRYGFTEDGHALSLRKTSKIVGLSQEGVRRVEQRAIGKLQRPGVCRELRYLLTA